MRPNDPDRPPRVAPAALQRPRALAALGWVLACLLAGACEGTLEEAAPTGGAAGSGSAAGAGGSARSAGAGAAAGGSAASAGSAAVAASTDLLPARLRRLTNAELDASVHALLGIESSFAASFTPDTRQGGFTRNDAQRVDPVFVTQLSDAAQRWAASAKDKLPGLVPCADPAGSEACARAFIDRMAARAYRRPAKERELLALFAVYQAGSDGTSYADGLEAVVSAILQSPGFLYVTELGSAPAAAATRLTDYEIASALAFLVTGAPPDEALRHTAAAGMLGDPEVRRGQARRLLASDAAGAQVVRMVHEWLGIDRISETAKDSNVYPEFAGLRDAMKREAEAFVSEVIWDSDSNVRELFAADWTPADDDLARMYLGASDGQPPARDAGHVSLRDVRRRGILNQGAFLSVYAHAHETAPVLRGVAVLRRVACIDVPSPTSLNLNVVPPVPDPSKTTRERFSIHSKDAACAGCHDMIDPLGFSFEALDGMGRARAMENGQPVDSRTTLTSGYSFDGSYGDSAELSLRIAESSELADCFARQLFRHAVARSDVAAQAPEAAFMREVAALPAEARGQFAELLVAFVASDAFIQRGANP